MSVFSFIDEVSEVKKGESLTAFFTLKPGEEYLKDHFMDFPVMPGVLQLEALRQAADRFLNETGNARGAYRLKTVRSVKYGQFIKPDTRLKIFVRFLKNEGSSSHFEGRIDVLGENGLAGRAILADFSLVSVS